MIKSNNKRITRESKSNPFPANTFYERLYKSNTVVLEDNCIIEEYGNGYSKVVPKDKNKKINLSRGF